jgi:hypothetical protein
MESEDEKSTSHVTTQFYGTHTFFFRNNESVHFSMENHLIISIKVTADTYTKCARLEHKQPQEKKNGLLTIDPVYTECHVERRICATFT